MQFHQGRFDGRIPPEDDRQRRHHLARLVAHRHGDPGGDGLDEPAGDGVPERAHLGELPAKGDDAEVVGWRDVRTPFSTWLNSDKPTLFLSGDRMVTGDDRLLAPRTELPPYPRERLRALDWASNGVDITVESQGIERKANSIQAYMARFLSQDQTFDILIDDDRAGEAADLVGIRVDKGDLHITLVHCKYSSKPTPGSRLSDLYEVCGQAMRGARWRDNGALPLLEHLDRRAKAYTRRTGLSPFEIGDREALFGIRQQAPQLFPLSRLSSRNQASVSRHPRTNNSG